MSDSHHPSPFTIAPYKKTDFPGIVGMFAGYKPAYDEFRHHLTVRDMQDSFVATGENGHVLGFIIAEKHGKQIDMMILHTDDRDPNSDLCRVRLVTRLAEHCVQQKHEKMGIVVTDKNPAVLGLFNHVAHEVSASAKGPDGTNSEVYTVNPRNLTTLTP